MHTPPEPDTTSSQTDPERQPFPVVGIGASAGGVEALTTFFAHLPPHANMAFVVVLHLPPDAESNLAAILARVTTLPVQLVTESVSIAVNTISILPPHAQLTMGDDTLRLVPFESDDTAARMPIDHCFRTIATAYDSRAAAIILSGTGSDGASGLKRIKEAGGVTLVQDPQEAAWDGMPRMALSTGLVDFVLPVAALAEMLITYWQRGASLALPLAEADHGEDGGALLRDIFALLRVRTGHDFSQYKRPTVQRRLARRLQVTGAPDLPTYLALLRSRPEEVQALLGDLLISVTHFFRDPDAWTSVQTVLPQLFAHTRPTHQVRVWVTACATGEEAYSLAMLLREVADTLAEPPQIQVFATDIDEAAIALARQGLYPSSIAGDVSPARLHRFFVAEQGGYRITQDLRDLVLFAHHNVLHDPPFSRLDLITCRNLLIYLNQHAQAQVFQTFQFSLRPEGYLLLGSSESIDGAQTLFTTIDKAHRLFRRAAGAAVAPLRPLPVLPSVAPPPGPPPGPSRSGDSFGELHDQLAAAYTPPSVIVTDDGDIVHLRGGVGHFLRFSDGAVSQNLLQVVVPDLRLDLRTAFFTARHQRQPVTARGIRAEIAGAVQLVDLVVQPIGEPDWAQRYFLVVLHDVGAASALVEPRAADRDTRMAQLEAELERTTVQVRATIEQYDAAVEEYKAANEELQAINEELRAATEELETSKEEVQSINEELTTLNGELKHKVEEISRAHNDLQNLIASTQIGTIFLDRDRRIKRFTPSASAIFNLIPADLNRPLDHVTHQLHYDRLMQDAADVLHSLTPISREVETRTQSWYLMRLLPYRTLDDRIDGVVLTFVDITERKRAEAVLAERARLLDLSNDAIIVRDVDDRVIYWNHGATELYGWTRDEAVGHHLHTLLHTEFEAPLPQLIVTLQQHDRMEGEVVQVTRDGRRRTLTCRWALDRDAAGHPGAILTTYNDITERTLAEAERERLLAAEHAARMEAEAALQTREHFLSIASHELRTPLTALMGYAYLLPSVAAQGADPLARMSERITQQAQRLSRLIEQLLDVSRLQQGQFVIEPTSTDLAALVAQVVDDVRATQPPDTRHPIAVQRPDAPVLIMGDPHRLEQVLQNLLSNAVKYSPQGGQVQVRVGQTATDTVVEVSDQGIGIPAAAQAQLFEPFFRASNVGTQASGFGLGLHIVCEIVQRHGGRIEVESTEGRGSTFRVVLPRDATTG